MSKLSLTKGGVVTNKGSKASTFTDSKTKQTSYVDPSYVPRTNKSTPTPTVGGSTTSASTPVVTPSTDLSTALGNAKSQADTIQQNLNDSIASGEIESASTPSPDEYYPRYTPPEEEQAPTGPSTEEVQKDMMKDAQAQINSLNRMYKDRLDEQQTINQSRSRETSSGNTLTGLAGSSEANVNAQRTDSQNQAANNAIRNQQETAVQTVLSDIRTAAVTEGRELRTEARLDAETKEKNRVTREADAQKHIATLAQAGATIDGFKKTDPEGYSYLAKQAGGEQMIKAMFTLNRPQETILDKRIEGGKYVIAYQNPLDGKTRIETLDLGLPPQYTKTIDAGDRLMAIPDGWDGDPSKLITINKGLSPEQKEISARQTREGTDTGIGNSSSYGSDLDAIIGSTLSTIPSKFGQATFQSQINKSRNDQDKINLIASQVLKGQPAELRTDFANQAVGISNIDKAIQELDSGLQTGFLDSKLQYVANFFGRDYDPKLAKINSLIIAAIQPYRNSVTGAAWGTQEDGEYQSLFGSTKYSPTELRSRLVSVKEILKDKSAQGLNTFVNPMGYYDNQFDSGTYEPVGTNVQEKAEAAGYDYAAMRADGLSDEDIASSL